MLLSSTAGCKPTVKELMKLVYHEVPDKWKEIGKYLEIMAPKLNAIEQENLKNGHKCLMAMLEVWLERVDPLPTWEDLAEAVEFVGREDVAQKIREHANR